MKFFEVTVQILQTIVSWLLFTIVFFGKMKKTSRNLSHSFHILKTKAHFEKELHFENERVFLEKWKVINHFKENCNHINFDLLTEDKTFIFSPDVSSKDQESRKVFAGRLVVYFLAGISS